jgi:predicted outer membrane repeat protein
MKSSRISKNKIKQAGYLLSILLISGLALIPGMAGAVGPRVTDTSSRAGSFAPLIKFDTVYVNGTTGSDDYDGSSPVPTSVTIGPKKTIGGINGGIEVVSDSGTVNVAAGTYHEHGLHLSHTMNLIGAGALTTIIDGDALGFVLEVLSEPNQRNTISGFTIRDGAPSGSDSGGGIYIYQDHIVTINDCAIVNNVKGGGPGPLPDMGGGICNDGGFLYMDRCTVSGNTASGLGGGIYTHDVGGGFTGLTKLINCTISGNTANGVAGGGVYCGRNSTMELYNVTIVDNRAPWDAGVGGGFSNASPSSMHFKNCIVANNTAGDSRFNNGFDDYGGAAVLSMGHNIDSENSCFFTDTTDQRNTNPLLGALQNNGGQTSTHAITASSPAFNRGVCDVTVPTDQRGVTRPQGTYCDIGAFELQMQQSAQVPTATGTGIATFTTSNGSINNLIASLTTVCGALIGYYFPEGFFSFNITNITPGSTVTITITLPSNMPANTQYWKCINGQWLNCNSILGSNDGDNVLTLALTDGGPFDADGAANGIIVDPGGPVVSAAAPAGPKASGTVPNQFKLDQTSVQYMSINPKQAAVNQPVAISTNVANTGDNSVNYNVALMINGQMEQTRMVSVGPHASQPVKFTVTRAQPGTYSVDIAGQSGSFTILGNGNRTSTSTTNVGLIGILIIGFMVAIVIVLALILRRSAS